ncbi:MAG: TRAP transporter large permease [Planctomycetaceae bacterium]|nr:TRAP transporter large permease [Planctomycetaceae bacterium]
MIAFLIALAVLLAIGVPIFISLGLSSLLLWILEYQSVDFIMIFQKMFTGMDNFTLMAIPFFMLAGELMNTGGLSRRLVGFAQKTLGWIHGGLGFTTVLSSMLIAAILGSASASAAMIGMVMIPEMVQRGYRKDYAAALVASSGAIGPIIPPSIPLIIYGVIAQQSITKLFAAGYIPGLLMGALFMGYNYIHAKKNNYPAESVPTLKEFVVAFARAFLTLLLPVIIMGGILSGIFTPTEAGVVAVAYAFFIGVIVYREIKIPDIPAIFLRAAKSSAMILMVMAVASYLSWILTMQRIPQMVSRMIVEQSAGAVTFLIVVNILMIILGMFLDAVSALTITTPVLLPAALALKVDPVVFGVMLAVNLSIGVLTPPVGLNLYVTAGIAKIGLVKISRAVVPFIMLIILILMVMIVFPRAFVF